MKGIRNLLFLIAVTGYLVMVTSFVSSRESQLHVTSVKIRVTDSTENRFLQARDINRLLAQKQIKLSGVPSSSVNLEAIEQSLASRQIISTAEAYITEPGILHIDVKQKSPFVRIYNRMGQGYFLDRSGNVIPSNGNFSPYVLVANGNISEPFRVGQTLNIFDVPHDSLPASKRTLYDLFTLVTFISDNRFWNEQIVQVYVNAKNEFELVPRVGSQVIELGGIDNLAEKFGNLRLLYEEGFSQTGWNQYGRISLKYKNQVVCTKNQSYEAAE